MGLIDTLLTKLVYPQIKKIEFGGLILEVLRIENSYDWQIGDHKKFIFTVYNPKNVAYTTMSLSKIIDENIENAFRMASYSGPGSHVPTFFWEFDENFTEIYIPPRMIDKINKCITSVKNSTEILVHQGITKEDLLFKIDYGFYEINYIDFNDIDSINISLGVYIKNILSWDYEKKDFVSATLNDEEETLLYDEIHEMGYDGYEIFTNAVWGCFAELSEQKTFIDMYTHGINIDFYFQIKQN